MTKGNSLQNPNGVNSFFNQFEQIPQLPSIFNFQELFSLIEETDKESKDLENFQNKSVILLLGTTGSGKSTTIQYLCGSEMYKTQCNGLYYIDFRNALNKDLLNVKVSPFARSETRNVTPISIDLKQLGSSISKNFTIVDTPGLFDITNAEADVSQSLGVLKALSQIERMRPIIVISYQNIGPRGDQLKKIFNYYSQMIQESRNIEYFNFFFSRVDSDVKMKNLTAQISNILEELDQEERQNYRLVKFLEQIIERAQNNKLFIIDPLNKKDILRIIDEILKSDEILEPSSVFKQVICKQSNQKIIQQFDLHANSILNAFKSGDANSVDYMLTELQKFCKIMDQNQEYKNRLNEIFKQLHSLLTNKQDEIISIFQQKMQPRNLLTEQDIQTYQSYINFSASHEEVRKKFLCNIDGQPDSTRSHMDIEKEVAQLIKNAFEKLQNPNLWTGYYEQNKNCIQQLMILANSEIQSIVSIKDEILCGFLDQFNKGINEEMEKIRKSLNLIQNDDNQTIDSLIRLNEDQGEKMLDQLLDQFLNLLKELQQVEQSTKNVKFKQDIENQNQ